MVKSQNKAPVKTTPVKKTMGKPTLGLVTDVDQVVFANGKLITPAVTVTLVCSGVDNVYVENTITMKQVALSRSGDVLYLLEEDFTDVDSLTLSATAFDYANKKLSFELVIPRHDISTDAQIDMQSQMIDTIFDGVKDAVDESSPKNVFKSSDVNSVLATALRGFADYLQGAVEKQDQENGNDVQFADLVENDDSTDVLELIENAHASVFAGTSSLGNSLYQYANGNIESEATIDHEAERLYSFAPDHYLLIVNPVKRIKTTDGDELIVTQEGTIYKIPSYFTWLRITPKPDNF